MNLFTFQNIAKKSDILLCKSGTEYWKNIYGSKVLFVENITTELENANTVFIWCLEFHELCNFFTTHKSSIKLLILAGTDETYMDSHLRKLLELLPSTNFLISNYIGNHPRCQLLPIFPYFSGMEQNLEIKKTNLFGISHVRINSIARIQFFKEIEDLPEVKQYFFQELVTSKYCEAISTLYFSCCPMGNGFDTHRFWESLYYGAIPIVKSHFFYTCLQKTYPNIPMIIIDEWKDLPECIDELSIEKYKSIMETADLSVFTQKYWDDKFASLT